MSKQTQIGGNDMSGSLLTSMGFDQPSRIRKKRVNRVTSTLIACSERTRNAKIHSGQIITVERHVRPY